MIHNASTRLATPVGLAACLLLAACGGGGDDEGASTTADGVAATTAADDDVAGTTPSGADGVPLGGAPANPGPNFTFAVGRSFVDTLNDSDEARDFVASIERFFDATLEPLNALDGLLPRTIPVSYEACGLANAFFDTRAVTITLCDELVMLFFESLSAPASGLDEDQAVQAAFATAGFVLYHEIGHALVQERDLPVVGNPESGADAIATVISVETGNSGYALYGAVSAFEQGAGTFSDVHGGGEDRAGDILCWAIGGDEQLASAEFLRGFADDFALTGRDCTGEYAAQRDIILRTLPGLGGLPQARAAFPDDFAAALSGDVLR